MKKHTSTQTEKFIGLTLYLLFKKQDCQEAFHIASLISVPQKDDQTDIEGQISDDTKTWIELGSKVNFAWLEKQSILEDILMSQHEFERLRITSPEMHKRIKNCRDKASTRWSYDWKQIRPRLLAAKSLAFHKPRPEMLELTWQSMLSTCARKLYQVDMVTEAKEIQELSLAKLESIGLTS